MNKITKKTIKPSDRPTPAQIREIELAMARTASPDEDSPELTYEEMLKMIKSAKDNDRKRETVTLRVSPSTLRKAKAVGKGYTGFLGRLIDNAINDKDLVARSL